jgi:aminopeptidase
MDARLKSMADVLVNYSIGVKPSDWVVIQSPVLGEPLVDACVRSVLEAGGHASPLLTSEVISETQYLYSNDEQLRFISPMTRLMYDQADARISILAPRNTRAMSSVDPAKMAVVSQASEPLMESMMRRTKEGSYSWTIAAYPTPAAAQDAYMSLRNYEEFLFSASLIDTPDPVAAWRELGARQQRLVEWITPRRDIHITGPGTDLRLSVEGRTWINDEGKKNFPGGEIFTAPVEDSVEGEIQFTYPAFYAGREVPGVRLVFERGVVREANSAGDQDFLDQMLSMDDGARRLGEFAFGTNSGIQTFTKNTLFDEKIGGTLHMALGKAYPECGGTNKSALHWDMVYDLRNDAEVTVDGELFSKNGEFQVLQKELVAG